MAAITCTRTWPTIDGFTRCGKQRGHAGEHLAEWACAPRPTHESWCVWPDGDCRCTPVDSDRSTDV